MFIFYFVYPPKNKIDLKYVVTNSEVVRLKKTKKKNLRVCLRNEFWKVLEERLIWKANFIFSFSYTFDI